MPPKYPPLTPGEVKAILDAWGFECERVKGSHHQYSGTIGGLARIVTVDDHYKEFDDKIIRYMIKQSGLTHEQFYRATKTTARKINALVNRPDK